MLSPQLPLRRGSRRLPLVTLYCVWMAAASINTAEAQVQTSLLHAWGVRQSQVRTFSFSWSGTMTRYLPQESVFPIAGAVIVDDQGRTRLDYDYLADGRRSSKTERLFITRAVDVVDGDLRTTFHEMTSREFPAAWIRGCSTNEVGRHIQVLVFGMALRPLDDAWAAPTRSLRETGTKSMFQGERCDVLATEWGLLYVTDDDRRLPVFYVELRDQREPVYDVRITFTENSTVGWLPLKWQIRIYQDGSVFESTEAAVTEKAINVPIPRERFQLTFPAGTWVQNLVTGESYIIRDGLPHREVLPGEYTGENYQSILSTEPPSQSKIRPRWSVVLIACIPMALGLYLLTRRRGWAR